MPDEGATSVIFFVASLYAFGIVLVYVLARAWEKALSTRPEPKQAVAHPRDINHRHGF